MRRLQLQIRFPRQGLLRAFSSQCCPSPVVKLRDAKAPPCLVSPFRTPPLTLTLLSRRGFLNSAPRLKKSRPNRGEVPPSASSMVGTNPLELDDVENQWKSIDVQYREEVKKLTSRGRFSPEVVGRISVKIPNNDASSAAAAAPAAAAALGAAPKGKKNHHQGDHAPAPGRTVEYPLNQLAQVVEGKGRNVSVFINEEQYLKPIMSAIQNSEEYNQQPQRGESPLELVLKVELTRPEEAEAQVRNKVEAWRIKVRDARARKDKALKACKADGRILPDALRKAEKELQRMQDKVMADIKKFEDEILRKIKATQL